MSDVAHPLGRAESGEHLVPDQLLQDVYAELRNLVAARMVRETPGQTLQACVLIREAYTHLVDADQPPRWNSHRYFFLAAAEAMRRICVEHTCRGAGPEFGSDLRPCALHGEDPSAGQSSVDILALHAALERLAAKDLRKAELVKLRFFAGLSNGQAAAVLGISLQTAPSDWRYARAWLCIAMEDQLATGG